MTPSIPSRLAVHVVLRTRTSNSPDCRAVNLASVSTSTNSTLVLSPSTAAAIARQKSASKPSCSPASSRMLNPGKSPRTPQRTTSAAITESRMESPACTSLSTPAASVSAPPPSSSSSSSPHEAPTRASTATGASTRKTDRFMPTPFASFTASLTPCPTRISRSRADRATLDHRTGPALRAGMRPRRR